MAELTATSLALDTEIAERLKRYADASSRAPREVLSEALDQYLNRQEKRAQFLQGARTSLAHYEETGLHLTGEEVDDWLAKLEAGEIIDPPQCHT